MPPGPALVLAFHDPVTRVVRREVLRPGMRIGARADLNDIVLPASGVNPAHAEVTVLADGTTVLSGMGSSTIGTATGALRKVSLAPGTRLSFGHVQAWVEAAGQPMGTVGAATAVPAYLAAPGASSSPSAVVGALFISIAAGAVVALGVAFGMGLLGPAPAGAPAADSPAVTPLPGEPTAPAVAGSAPTPVTVPTIASEEAMKLSRESLVTVAARFSSGPAVQSCSGFVVEGNRVVTSFRVVGGTAAQQVLVPGEKPFHARLVYQDQDRDLALLELALPFPKPPAPLAPTASHLKAGDAVYALALVSGGKQPTLALGSVTADGVRPAGSLSVVQHDASVDQTFGGGPLLDQSGHVVGVTTLKVQGAQGHAFAIPVEDLRAFLDDAP